MGKFIKQTEEIQNRQLILWLAPNIVAVCIYLILTMLVEVGFLGSDLKIWVYLIAISTINGFFINCSRLQAITPLILGAIFISIMGFCKDIALTEQYSRSFVIDIGILTAIIIDIVSLIAVCACLILKLIQGKVMESIQKDLGDEE